MNPDKSRHTKLWNDMKSCFVFFTLICLTKNCFFAYNILAYSPKLWQSHMIFVGKIADILSNAGHDVVLYQPTFDDNITITVVSHSRVIERPRYAIYNSLNIGLFEKFKRHFVHVPCRFRDFQPTFTMYDLEQDAWAIHDDLSDKSPEIGGMLKTLCEHQIKDVAIMERLRAEKFDLAIGEVFDGCFYGIVEKARIPAHISLSGTPMPDLYISHLGIPTMFGFVPGMAYGKGVPMPMSYWERIRNIWHILDWYHRMYRDFVRSSEEVISEDLGRKFDVLEKVASSAFYFVNADEFLDFPRPLSHKYIYIGGMPRVQPKPLKKKFLDIMENSNRAVLVSFGTIAQTHQMPQKFMDAFLAVFERFTDVTFLLKYESDNFANITRKYTNVFTAPWLPQIGLLGHPKLVGFITHGGLNSITESVVQGVPMVCIPLFADQLRNCEMMKYRKTSAVVTKAELKAQSLVHAVDQIINDNSYRKNARKLADMIASKPQSSEERIIKYAEFAARFGNDNNLDIEGRHMNYFKFYCLDIIIPVIGFFSMLLYLLAKILLSILIHLSLFVFKYKIE